jgi:hypothetical protein
LAVIFIESYSPTYLFFKSAGAHHTLVLGYVLGAQEKAPVDNFPQVLFLEIPTFYQVFIQFKPNISSLDWA